MKRATRGQALCLIRWALHLFWVVWGTNAQPLLTEIHYHPADDRSEEEFLELYNPTPTPINLSQWQLRSGIDFEFPPAAQIGAQAFLIVAANPSALLKRHATLDPDSVFGPWRGRLRDRGERIRLVDAQGETMQDVRFANEGAFAKRRWATDFRGVKGIQWIAEHDGRGPSLELQQWRLPNDWGRNWTSSQQPHGTPARSNSTATSNAAPLIGQVRHHPPIPTSHQAIRVSVEIADEAITGTTATLHYAVNQAPFQPLLMTPPPGDDPHHRLYEVTIPAQPDRSLIEFYIEARDPQDHRTTWPSPTLPDRIQNANAFLIVDDRPRNSKTPEYRILMPPSERQRFLDVVQPRITNAAGEVIRNQQIFSDGRFPATFISYYDGQYRVRHQVEVRNRGNGSRQRSPNNFRVDFATDDLWRRAEKLNLNAQFPWVQVMGSALSRHVGLLSAPSRLGRVYLNGVLRAPNAFPTYEMYAANDVMNADFAAKAGLDNANIYRGIRYGENEADFSYLGEDPTPYRKVYFKETNRTQDDWTDLISLTKALSQSSDETFESEVDRWIDLPQWIRFLAVEAFYVNKETALGNGFGDDYYLYRSEQDGRFRLLPYDQDTILGQGDTPADPHASLWEANRGPVTRRLLNWPAFAPLFYSNLVELATGPLSTERLRPFLDRLLQESNVPSTRQTQAIEFAAARSRFILATVNQTLTSEVPLAREGSIYRAPAGTTSVEGLWGTSDPTRTVTVKVNGQNATWDPSLIRWTAPSLPLEKGRNRFTVEAFDRRGATLDRQGFEIEVPITKTSLIRSPALTTQTTWKTGDPARIINHPLRVPAGIELRIEPGVEVRFGPKGRLVIEGHLRILGRPLQPVVFTSVSGARWHGLEIRPQASAHLEHLIIEGTRPNADAITTTSATLHISQSIWREVAGSALFARDSAITLEGCQFFEAGVRLENPPAGEPTTIQDCRFTGTLSLHPAIQCRSHPDQASSLVLHSNHFVWAHHDAIQLIDQPASLMANQLIGALAPEAHSLLSVIHENRPEPLMITLARNIFSQSARAIEARGRVSLRAHNNTFDAIANAVLQIPSGTISLEYINNLHRNTPNGSVLSFPAEGMLIETLRSNLSDQSMNLATAVVPADHLGLSGEEGGWRIDRDGPLPRAGHSAYDLGATADAFPDLSHTTRSRWPLSGGFLPLWAPGGARFEIRSTRLDASLPVQTIPNGGEWRPVATEPQLQEFQVALYGPSGRILGTEFITLDFDQNAPRVELSELSAGGSAPDGSNGNWIELRNRIDRPVDLSGYHLSDTPKVPDKFLIPEGTLLPARGSLIFFGSSPDPSSLPFRFSATGESVILSNPRGERIDSLTYGLQAPQATLAKSRAGRWRLALPTPLGENEFLFTGTPQALRISEFLSRPLSNDPVGEFVELVNDSPLPIPLEEVCLSDAPEIDPRKQGFPALSFIGPNAFLTLAENPESIQGARALSFGLSSQPSALALSRSSGQSIDVYAYGPQRTGWSEGRGRNFERASFPVPNPGQPNPSLTEQPHPVQLSEIIASNQSVPAAANQRVSDWVELYNTSTLPVTLSQLALTDHLDRADPWSFPPDTIIAPLARMVICFDSTRDPDDRNTGFGLSASGDQVLLLERAPDSTRVIDQVSFGFQAPDISIARIGFDASWHPAEPTPGLANQAARLGDATRVRFNEWLASATEGPDWFELYNPTQGIVDLSGFFLSDDRLRPFQHPLPNLSFLGSGHHAWVQLIADGNPTENARHVDFKLSADGEDLLLSSDTRTIIDAIRFGPQNADRSEGFQPDGGSLPTPLDRPSPGASNDSDQDQDGLPDGWERLVGLNQENALDAQEDADDDGLTNREEFQLRSDPFDPRSGLSIQTITYSAGRIRLTFDVLSGRYYEVQQRPFLAEAPWETIWTLQPALQTGPAFAEFESSEDIKFFRIVSPQPTPAPSSGIQE